MRFQNTRNKEMFLQTSKELGQRSGGKAAYKASRIMAPNFSVAKLKTRRQWSIVFPVVRVISKLGIFYKLKLDGGVEICRYARPAFFGNYWRMCSHCNKIVNQKKIMQDLKNRGSTMREEIPGRLVKEDPEMTCQGWSRLGSSG